MQCCLISSKLVQLGGPTLITASAKRHGGHFQPHPSLLPLTSPIAQLTEEPAIGAQMQTGLSES